MGAIATTYMVFFSRMLYRARQLQYLADSGAVDYAHYIHPQSEEVWELRNTLSLLKEKPFEELVYIDRGWKYLVVKEIDEEVVNEQGITEIITRKIYADPNGVLNGKQYFKQDIPLIRLYRERQDELARSLENDPIAYYDDLFDEFRLMTEDTVWFDTGACLQGPKIGDINKVKAEATTPRYDTVVKNFTIPVEERIIPEPDPWEDVFFSNVTVIDDSVAQMNLTMWNMEDEVD